MEDRKRPASDEIGSTPPSKRQAVNVNGSSSHADSELPWNDDIDRYQKDAIIRQMREFKREKTTLEQQLAALSKRAESHDDHIRLIDAWFIQRLDEMAVFANAPAPQPSDQLPPFESTLLTSPHEQFEKFLLQRSDKIKSTITRLFANAPSASPDIRELQGRLSTLLAAQKTQAAQLQTVLEEKERLSERLEIATTRYIVAEKRLDRARSAQVAKLEAQAIASSRPEGSNTETAQDGVVEEKPGGFAASEAARKDATALAEKRRNQLEKVVSENVKLTNELTALQAKFAGLGDDDYAKTELFTALKTQHTDVIKNLNHLEAINTKLREDTKVLQGERTLFREEADNELRSATIELQSQLGQSEAEIARVKQQRDTLHAELEVRKATVEDNKASVNQLRELIQSRDTRITALEAEVGRLRTREAPDAGVDVEDDGPVDARALRQKLQQAVSERNSLETELRSMEAAWRKASAVANKKLIDILDAEEKIQKFSAEKGKADQKYFASMKTIDTMKHEMRLLRAQEGKSSDIVSQLKQAESDCRSLLISLEKQLAEVKDALGAVSNQYRTAERGLSEQKSSAERLTGQSTELKKLLSTKDTAVQVAEQAQRQAENDLVETKSKLERAEKDLVALKKKGVQTAQNEEYENLKIMVMCNVCHLNFKNTVLKSCGHVCCRQCIDKQLQLRSRKCPLCGKVFATSDSMHITL